MQENLIEAISLSDIAEGVIACIFFWVLSVAVNRLSSYLKKITSTSKYFLNGIRLTLLSSLWIIFNACYFHLLFPYPKTIAVLTFIGFVYILWSELKKFSQAGLLGSDSSVSGGLNYDESLKLCTNELAFLGIGASKLTESKEFIAAIERCNRQNVAIRFLLTKPDNPLLVNAAKRKNVKPEEYSNRVKKSLNILYELKTDREMNIEVRFYPSEKERDFPFFRLMFIDDSLCLLSYNVFGEGNGSQLPQLHLKKFQDRRDVESFYYPFKLFFDHLWNESLPWDFKSPFE